MSVNIVDLTRECKKLSDLESQLVSGGLRKGPKPLRPISLQLTGEAKRVDSPPLIILPYEVVTATVNCPAG